MHTGSGTSSRRRSWRSPAGHAYGVPTNFRTPRRLSAVAPGSRCRRRRTAQGSVMGCSSVEDRVSHLGGEPGAKSRPCPRRRPPSPVGRAGYSHRARMIEGANHLSGAAGQLEGVFQSDPSSQAVPRRTECWPAAAALTMEQHLDLVAHLVRTAASSVSALRRLRRHRDHQAVREAPGGSHSRCGEASHDSTALVPQPPLDADPARQQRCGQSFRTGFMPVDRGEVRQDPPGTDQRGALLRVGDGPRPGRDAERHRRSCRSGGDERGSTASASRESRPAGSFGWK